MTNAITYHAVFRKGDPLPRALFRLEEDACQWHDAPALYSNARRRVLFDERPYRVVDPAANRLLDAVELLRGICLGTDDEAAVAVQNGIAFLKGHTDNCPASCASCGFGLRSLAAVTQCPACGAAF